MHEVRRLPAAQGPNAPGDDLHDDGTVVEGLLDGLLSDVLPEPPGPLDAISRAVEAHREHARAWYGDLIGPLSVPAAAAAGLAQALRPNDHGMRLILRGPAGVSGAEPEELMRGARAQLLDDDRIELSGVEIDLLPAPSTEEAAQRTLDGLDASAPAWLRIPPDTDWLEALDVIVEDGAEHVALLLPHPQAGALTRAEHTALASMIQALASRSLRFCLIDPAGAPGTGGIDLVTGPSGYGLLNLLCAIGSAAEAAAVDDAAAIADSAARLAHVAGLLGETSAETVIEEVRRIGVTRAAAIRGLLDRVSCASIRALIGDLEAAGLIVPDVA